MLTSNEEISKIEKTYLWKHRQGPTSFSSPRWTNQSLTKASSFPINLSVFRKHVCQMSRSSPWGMLKPSPRGWDKIVNVPLPGLTTSANTPRLPGGDGLGSDTLCSKNSSIMLLSVTQKNLELCPKLCSKNIALCSPDFYCIQHVLITTV